MQPDQSQKICFVPVGVDQNTLMQLLSSQPQGAPQQPFYFDQTQSKANGFQAALFLTPPKVNSGSLTSTPGSHGSAEQRLEESLRK